MKNLVLLLLIVFICTMGFAQTEPYFGGVGRGDVHLTQTNILLGDPLIYYGGVGRGDVHVTYQAPALGIYFTGITTDFTLNSNWSSGVFPTNDFAVVRGTGTQPVLSSTFTLGGNSRIYLQDQATLTLDPSSSL